MKLKLENLKKLDELNINFFLNYDKKGRGINLLVFTVDVLSEKNNYDTLRYISAYGYEGGGCYAEWFAKSTVEKDEEVWYGTFIRGVWDRKFSLTNNNEEIEGFKEEKMTKLDIDVYDYLLKEMLKIVHHLKDGDDLYGLNEDIMKKLDKAGNYFSENFDSESVEDISKHWSIKYKWHQG